MILETSPQNQVSKNYTVHALTTYELSGTRRFNQMKYRFGLVWYGFEWYSVWILSILYVLPCRIWAFRFKVIELWSF